MPWRPPPPSQDLPSCDAYFESIKHKKKLPPDLQWSLTRAFHGIPVSAFPEVPRGEVLEIDGDTPILEAVRILAENSIMSAPVVDPDPDPTIRRKHAWQARYLGILDYSAIVVWVLRNLDNVTLTLTVCGYAAESPRAAIPVAASPSSSIDAAVNEIGSGVASLSLSSKEAGSDMASPHAAIPVASSPSSSIDAAVNEIGSGVASLSLSSKEAGSDMASPHAAIGVADKDTGSDVEESKDEEVYFSSVTKYINEDLFNAIQSEEPFKSVTAKMVVKRYKVSPFLPAGKTMLSVLLLLSKYRLRNVPVVQPNGPFILNFITQSAIIRGLNKCKRRDWYDYIASLPLTDFGLPFMKFHEMKCIHSDDFLMEAFKIMADNYIAGLPIIEGPNSKLVGNLSIRAIRFVLLRPDLFPDIRDMTVKEFMETVGSAIPESGMLDPPLTCTKSDTMGSIIEKIASRYVHRIYVVKGELPTVIGVISLRDIISCFVNEPPEYLDNHIRDIFETCHCGIPKNEREPIFGDF